LFDFKPDAVEKQKGDGLKMPKRLYRIVMKQVNHPFGLFAVEQSSGDSSPLFCRLE
jgi:hypothetical protein